MTSVVIDPWRCQLAKELSVDGSGILCAPSRVKVASAKSLKQLGCSWTEPRTQRVVVVFPRRTARRERQYRASISGICDVGGDSLRPRVYALAFTTAQPRNGLTCRFAEMSRPIQRISTANRDEVLGC